MNMKPPTAAAADPIMREVSLRGLIMHWFVTEMGFDQKPPPGLPRGKYVSGKYADLSIGEDFDPIKIRQWVDSFRVWIEFYPNKPGTVGICSAQRDGALELSAADPKFFVIFFVLLRILTLVPGMGYSAVCYPLMVNGKDLSEYAKAAEAHYDKWKKEKRNED